MTIETYLPLILYLRNRIAENDRDSEDEEDEDSDLSDSDDDDGFYDDFFEMLLLVTAALSSHNERIIHSRNRNFFHRLLTREMRRIRDRSLVA